MGGECKGGERRGGEGSSRPVRGGMAVFGLPGSQFTSALFLSDMVQISCLSKAEVTGHFTAPNRNWARAKGTGEDQKLISLSQRSETQTRQPWEPSPCPLCCNHPGFNSPDLPQQRAMPTHLSLPRSQTETTVPGAPANKKANKQKTIRQQQKQ